MTRIAIGGFLHETNTFAPTKATYDDFVHGGGWPAMAHGADVLKVMRNINVGLAGFVEDAEANGWELIPTVSCGASPSAHVTKDAFERIVKEMVDGIAAAGRLDAVYLDLHGAMVTEHFDDGEGEILARVRKVIGQELPLVVSLDLHANVTPEMVEHADALIAYRTYPHVDMADTGRAAARHLALMLKTKQRFAKAFRQLPFLIPISWQCTNDQPTKGIYEKLAALEGDTVPTLSFARDSPPPISATADPACSPMAGRKEMPMRRPTRLQRWSKAMRMISTARSIRPTKACATRCSSRRPRQSRSLSPTPRTIPARAAIPIPPECFGHWCATKRAAPQPA